MKTDILEKLVQFGPLQRGNHELHPVLVAAFWRRVRPDGDCWRWIGNVHPQTGYGAYSFRGKGYRAHRLSLMIHGVAVPDHLDACHHCDNRWCVNPNHLYVGTRRQNMADCTARGRHNKPVGEKHWRAKLSTRDVLKIRELSAARVSQTAIANKFNIHPATVSRIARGEWRKEVP